MLSQFKSKTQIFFDYIKSSLIIFDNLFIKQNWKYKDWHSLRIGTLERVPMVFCKFMETFKVALIYCFPMKNIGNLINRIKVSLYGWGFYNEEFSMLYTVQPSGIVFRHVLKCQLRKSFVHLKMSYNSKSACHKSCESSQKWQIHVQKETTYIKDAQVT